MSPDDSAGRGGERHGGGRPGGKRQGGNRPYGGGSGGGGGRPGGRPGAGPRGGQGQTPPLEAAARSTRNALRRHAESLRDRETRLACRAVLSGIGGAGSRVTSPAEVLGIVEQVGQVAESSHPDFALLPAPLRATVGFATESPKRSREVLEMLRLLLRHGYALAADHIPRQMRNDSEFRSSALRDVIADIAREYLSDADFEAAAR